MMKNIIKDSFLKDERGHYIVEATVILPILMMVVISIGIMCRVYAIDENVTFAMVDEGRKAMINTHFMKIDPLLSSRIRERIINENKNVDNVKINQYRSGMKYSQNNELINVNLNYRYNFKLPIMIYKDKEREKNLLCRRFVGDNEDKLAFEFDNMKKEEADNTIIIFPYSGEKYHKHSCSYVKPEPTMVTLSADIKSRYKPCEICKSKNISNGVAVYIFNDYGHSYHLKGCSIINKNIITIDRRIVKKKGYTPCAKCGG
ncbi:MAG: hypothetical protein PUI85_02655 [Eubacteriales bacterium]|nr:hypothetical protein [Eubacteriales bacterium]MDY3332587.1 hypothetical protein [Gallibacter sp.]